MTQQCDSLEAKGNKRKQTHAKVWIHSKKCASSYSRIQKVNKHLDNTKKPPKSKNHKCATSVHFGKWGGAIISWLDCLICRIPKCSKIRSALYYLTFHFQSEKKVDVLDETLQFSLKPKPAKKNCFAFSDQKHKLLKLFIVLNWSQLFCFMISMKIVENMILFVQWFATYMSGLIIEFF